MVRAYWSTWIFFGAVSLLLLAAGLINGTTLTILGFVAFGLVFAGMICVLPTMASHPVDAHQITAPLVLEEERKAPGFGVLKSV